MRILLVLLSVGVQVASCAWIPIVRVEDIGYKAGHQIGTEMKDSILQAMKDGEYQDIFSFIASGKGKTIFEDFVRSNQNAFPHYHAELQGLSDAAGVPFNHILAMNMEQELTSFMNDTSRRSRRRYQHCTDVLHNNGNGIVWGHNEDGAESERSTSYIVIHQNANDSKSLRFFGYTYGGQLSGNAFGFNSRGLIITNNELDPKNVKYAGLANNFVQRDVLEATSFDDAIARAAVANQAVGASFNIFSMTENKMANIETGVGVKDVQMIDALSGSFHANQYLRLTVEQDYDESSVQRLKRYEQLSPITDAAGILGFLGDTANSQYPIYRNTTKPDEYSTLASMVFLLNNHTTADGGSNRFTGTARLYVRNPKLYPTEFIGFPLPW